MTEAAGRRKWPGGRDYGMVGMIIRSGRAATWSARDPKQDDERGRGSEKAGE